MPQTEEWDWPPPRRPRADPEPPVEGRIRSERIVLTPNRGIPIRPKNRRRITATQAATGTLKGVVAIPLGLLIAACVAFIVAVLGG